VQGKINRTAILFCFYGVETLSLDQSWYSNLKKDYDRRPGEFECRRRQTRVVATTSTIRI
jgi:hypothetical protein